MKDFEDVLRRDDDLPIGEAQKRRLESSSKEFQGMSMSAKLTALKHGVTAFEGIRGENPDPLMVAGIAAKLVTNGTFRQVIANFIEAGIAVFAGSDPELANMRKADIARESEQACQCDKCKRKRGEL